MDPRKALEIMSQGAIRPETATDRREREVLRQDLEGSPVTGKALRQRLRNFRPDPGAHLLATGGPTAWMRRLRAIEEETDAHELRLAEAWRELALECDGEEFARRWRDTAGRWSFYAVNRLIEQHNRNFPAEAQLPTDPRTRDFVRLNGYSRDPLDARWILGRFPADHRLAALALEARAS